MGASIGEGKSRLGKDYVGLRCFYPRKHTWVVDDGYLRGYSLGVPESFGSMK